MQNAAASAATWSRCCEVGNALEKILKKLLLTNVYSQDFKVTQSRTYKKKIYSLYIMVTDLLELKPYNKTFFSMAYRKQKLKAP